MDTSPNSAELSPEGERNGKQGRGRAGEKGRIVKDRVENGEHEASIGAGSRSLGRSSRYKSEDMGHALTTSQLEEDGPGSPLDKDNVSLNSSSWTASSQISALSAAESHQCLPRASSYGPVIEQKLRTNATASLRDHKDFDTFVEWAQSHLNFYLASCVSDVYEQAQTLIKQREMRYRRKMEEYKHRYRQRLRNQRQRLEREKDEAVRAALESQRRELALEADVRALQARHRLASPGRGLDTSSSERRANVTSMDEMEVDALVASSSFPDEEGEEEVGSPSRREQRRVESDEKEDSASPTQSPVPPAKASSTAADGEKESESPTTLFTISLFCFSFLLVLLVMLCIFCVLFDPSALGLSSWTPAAQTLYDMGAYPSSLPRELPLTPLRNGLAQEFAAMYKGLLQFVSDIWPGKS